MRRIQVTLARARMIPFVVALALVASCSSPNRETAAAAPAPAAPAEPAEPAPSQPAPSQPVPPAAETNPPVAGGAPTPAETPLPPPPPPAPEAAAGEEKASTEGAENDPLKWLAQQEAKRAEYQQNLAKLQGELDAAKENLAKAQKDLLAFKNPYMARPNLKPEEAGEVQGMSGVDRVKWAEGRIADGTAALEKAQKAYDDAKANPPS